MLILLTVIQPGKNHINCIGNTYIDTEHQTNKTLSLLLRKLHETQTTTVAAHSFSLAINILAANHGLIKQQYKYYNGSKFVINIINFKTSTYNNTYINNLSKQTRLDCRELNQQNKCLYKQENVRQWCKYSTFVAEKSAVVVRESGNITNFASDCACQHNKLQQNYKQCINIGDSKNHYIKKIIMAILNSLGAQKISVPAVQFTNLFSMSTANKNNNYQYDWATIAVHQNCAQT